MKLRTLSVLLGLALAAVQSKGAVPSLTIGGTTYENVTLRNEYPRSLFIKHDGGVAFVERSAVSEEQLSQLLGTRGSSAPATENETQPKAKPAEPQYIHPSPESLASEEERKFFEACGKADTATIVAMLKANPGLAKVTIKGQSSKRFLPEVDSEGELISPMRVEPADAACDALQWLVDQSEKSPGRIEAIKALVEAGAEPSLTTSAAGCNMARNTVSRPSMLSLEELDYLLSKGAKPDFGFCVAAYPPAALLARDFASADDPAKKEEARQALEIYIRHGANPEATGSPSFIIGRPKGREDWKDITIASAADVAKASGDTDLEAILAKKKN